MRVKALLNPDPSTYKSTWKKSKNSKRGRFDTHPAEPSLFTVACSCTSCVCVCVFLQKRWWGHFDIENTACAREALIHGIAGGMTVGVLYFMRSGEPL